VVALQTGYNLVKNGGGTWTLAATNTYLGTTTVSNGTLMVTGVVPTNTVTIAGGTLAGTGMVRGATTVQVAGTLAPGNNGIGTLIISNALTLQGTNLMEIARNGAVLANDQIVVSNNVANLSGTLIVTNIGSSALQVGDSFKLLTATNYTGAAFATVVLPAGPTWTNKLAVDGTIAILAVPVTVNTNATNLTATYGGGNLQLGWPTSHIGWELQVQTNGRSVGLWTNWFVVPGSTTTNQMTIPTSPANGTVFYRLHLNY
jgi:autotransporter-associated beta strand protein